MRSAPSALHLFLSRWHSIPPKPPAEYNLPRRASSMCFRTHCLTSFAIAISLAGVPQLSLARSHDKTVWNFDGGIVLRTDGAFPDGPCFRLAGRVTAPRFFDNLKRIDTDHGAVFRRGGEPVTHFPDAVLLSFVLRDQPCNPGIQQVGTRVYLTREMVGSLQLSLYWKRGVDLRPVEKFKELRASVTRIAPYAASVAAEIPERFEWSYDLAIPSAGVPLTDSLVLVFRLPDGHIATRVAARM